MRMTRHIVEKLLHESKKQSHFLKKISKEDTTSSMREMELQLEEIECYDGQKINASDLKAVNPNKFALEFVKKVKGQKYLACHICEPATGNTNRIPMERDFVALLKRFLTARFEKFDWDKVKESINRCSRDIERKLLLNRDIHESATP